MAAFSLQRLLFLTLLSTNWVTAGRFRFSVQEISTNTTRDISEDDLILGIATSTNSGSNNKTWTIGPAVEGSVFKWDNLTQEVEVPASGSNLSVAIGVMNKEAGGEVVAAGKSSPIVVIYQY
ncbi:unnamed protein product [Periconia digitata]|uniref:Uncharacterized protein n=1 Tax=Periconia digitata TaxID=1303443 RepID=A0A9W4XNF8_9PLEO|nr:unnamed protein product [Periconia digitata]